MMQVAIVCTAHGTFRSEIYGWTFDDAGLLVRKGTSLNPYKIFIGFTPSPKNIPCYGTILEMLADGWVLLGPPIKEITRNEGSDEDIEVWDWWLTRNQTEGVK